MRESALGPVPNAKPTGRRQFRASLGFAVRSRPGSRRRLCIEGRASGSVISSCPQRLCECRSTAARHTWSYRRIRSSGGAVSASGEWTSSVYRNPDAPEPDQERARGRDPRPRQPGRRLSPGLHSGSTSFPLRRSSVQLRRFGRGSAGFLLRPRVPLRLARRRAHPSGAAADPVWQPILLGGIWQQSGGGSWARHRRARRGHAGDRAARRASTGSSRSGGPTDWPTNTLKAMRAAIFAQQTGRAVAFSLAAFRQAFAGGQGPRRARQRPDRRRRLRAPSERRAQGDRASSRPRTGCKRRHPGGLRARRQRRADASPSATSSSGATTASRTPARSAARR